jgi:cytoplasmic iron level regulating protein YaaA (DUF328/UPF0246 family)
VYILLPPSEGKSQESGKGSFRRFCPERVSEVQPVVDWLGQLSVSAQRTLYGLKSEVKAAEAHAQNLAALDAPCIKAISRYTGVVYDFLDINSLPNLASARKRILIASALFGLVNGDTPLPAYKLSMTPWLTKHWRPLNTERLVAITQGKPVLNLLSQTYAKAVDYPALVTVDFRVDGGAKAAGHFGKAIKGRFVRWVLENKIKRVADFEGTHHPAVQYAMYVKTGWTGILGTGPDSFRPITKRESFGLCEGQFTGCAIIQRTGKLQYFRYPAPSFSRSIPKVNCT